MGLYQNVPLFNFLCISRTIALDGRLITPSMGVPRYDCVRRTVSGPSRPSTVAPTLLCRARMTRLLPLLLNLTVSPYNACVTLLRRWLLMIPSTGVPSVCWSARVVAGPHLPSSVRFPPLDVWVLPPASRARTVFILIPGQVVEAPGNSPC